LDRLDASVAVKDMNYPGTNKHQLKGKLKGVWSVKVSGNLSERQRLCSGL